MSDSQEEEKDKKLFVNFEVLNTKTKAFYSFMLVLGISASYALLGHFVLPLYIAGQMALYTYMLINIGISVLWVGLINIINRFILQDKLISKGATYVDC